MPSGHFRLGVPSGHSAERALRRAERARRTVRIRPTALSTGSGLPNGP